MRNVHLTTGLKNHELFHLRIGRCLSILLSKFFRNCNLGTRDDRWAKWLTLNESNGLESRRRFVINSARFAIDESAIKAERVARDGRKQILPSNGSIFKSSDGDSNDSEAREFRSSRALCKNACN